MRKTSISQRWEERFVEKTKAYAMIAGCSMTQFTIDAISLLGNLLEFEEIIDMDNHERIEYMSKAITSYHRELQKEYAKAGKKLIPNSRKKKSDRVREFLQSNPGRIYSTNELAEILNINQSTVRTYVAKLGENGGFKIYTGRPNRIEFLTDI